MRIWTIGHANRGPEAFLALLEREGVRRVVDVRTAPRSRYNPWTSLDALPSILAERGIAHAHLRGLGGLRKPRLDSPNAGWRNTSFRGYADHMGTPEFETSLSELLGLAAEAPTAIMCAEALPWRCHRALVADALLARGIEVAHILDAGLRPHTLTPFARVDGARVTYPLSGGMQTRLDD